MENSGRAMVVFLFRFNLERGYRREDRDNRWTYWDFSPIGPPPLGDLVGAF